MDESKTTERQAYWCEACGTRGYVDHGEPAGVYEVINAIRRDHANRSNGCDRIRVQNEAWVRDESRQS